MNKKNKAGKIIGIILIIVALVVLTVVLITSMRGETKTFGQNPANIAGQSLTCESDTIRYSIAEYDDSKAKNLKITANFYDDKLNSISLAYTLYYDDAKQITASETFNHADMNTSFSKNSLSTDAFNAHYSKLEDSMKMTLYATKDDLTVPAVKYFMIDAHAEDDLPNKLSEFQRNYETQGFICETNN